MLAGSFVAAAGGSFLVLAWLQNRDAWPMLWWAGANFMLAASLPLAFAASSFDAPGAILGATLLNLSPAMIWASGRSSNNLPVRLELMAAGAVLWLVAIMIPGFREMAGSPGALSQAIVAIYLIAAAREFLRKPVDDVAARRPLLVLLSAHALVFCYAAFTSIRFGAAGGGFAFDLWLDFVHFETLIFIVGTSIFSVAMTREQNEIIQRRHANTDELTGLHNRRAFYRDGCDALEVARVAGRSVSVIVFDLDTFKSINDRFGHGLGDAVLRVFATAAQSSARTTDVIGRIGGEEFAAILPGAGSEAARDVAERIRVEFSEAGQFIGVRELRPTLSAGVATMTGGESLDRLIGLADLALYRAKCEGRDRVSVYDPTVDGDGFRRHVHASRAA